MSLAEASARHLSLPGLSLLRWRDLGWLAVGVGLLAVLQGTLPDSQVYTGATAVATAIALLGLGLVSGSGGMISLCQLAFAAIGAWVVAFLSIHHAPGSLVLWVLLGGLAAVPFGIAIGLPALRLRGLHLAILTLAFAAMADAVFNNVGFPGDATDTPVVRPALFSSDYAYFVFAGVWLLAAAVGVVMVSRSRLGAGWRSMRSSERATAALGQSVPRLKLLAFALSALLGGIAGGIVAGQIGVVSETSFVPVQSLVLFAVSVMIGAQYAEAAIFGGVFAVVVPQLFTLFHISNNWATVVFGALALFALRAGTSLSEDVRERIALKGALTVEPPPSRVRTVEDRAPRPVSEGRGLEVEGLRVAYGPLVVLDGVDLVVRPGTVTGLIGPNGAGKSTLVDVLTGFVPARSGTVRLDGRALDTMAPHERALAGLRRTFQQDRVPRSLHVGEYLRLAAPRNLADDETLEAYLEAVGVPGLERPIATLDVGTCRLLEIAAGLAGRPKVLVLDEPAAGLGPEEKRRLADRLPGIPERFGTSVLLIEHDLDLVRSACATAIALDFGHVIGTGPPDELLRSEPVSVAYLGEALLA